MRFRLGPEKLAIILLYVFVIGLVSIFNSANPGNIESTPKLEQINEEIGDDSVSIYVQVLSFDEIHQSAKLRMYIYPPKRFGNPFSSSVQTYYRTKLTLDAARIESEQDLNWNAGEFIRAVDFQIDATNEAVSSRASDAFYPFDRYSLRSYATLEIQVEGEATRETNDDVWISPPLRIIPYTNVLPGWSIAYDTFVDKRDANDIFSNGGLALELKLARPTLHKYIVIFLSAIFFLGSLAISTYSLRVIANKKVPQIEGLVWSASTIFTLIQTRNVLPNEPRIGIKLDLIVFYPAIAITFLGSVLVFYAWLAEKSTTSQSIVETTPK